MKEDVLPEGWELKKLGSVVQYEKGKKPSNLNDEKNDIFTIPYIDIQGFEKGIIKSWTDGKNARLCQNSDLLMVWDGARAGLVGSGSAGALGSTLMKISFPKVNHTYGFYFLYSKFSDINSNTKGTGIPHVDPSVLWNFEFPIPPLPEQQYLSKKLTALLDEVAQTKQRLEVIPALLKQFRQSVLADAVSGRLTEAWRNTKGIKKNWKYEKAQNICDKVQSGSTPRGNPFDKNGTIPFLKVYNIVNQAINFDYKPQFITIEDHSKRSTALPNDILMNIVGPPLGKIAILTEQYPEWNINQAITLFRVNKEILNYKYLYFLLCEGSFIREIEHNLKGSVGQVNISLSQCRDMIIPTPPLEEQTQIVQKVETYFALADEIEAQVNAALENVNLLTQSILAKAFSGELSAAWRNSKVTETQGNV